MDDRLLTIAEVSRCSAGPWRRCAGGDTSGRVHGASRSDAGFSTASQTFWLGSSSTRHADAATAPRRQIAARVSAARATIVPLAKEERTLHGEH